MRKQDFEMYIAILLIAILVGVLLWRPIPLPDILDEKSFSLVFK